MNPVKVKVTIENQGIDPETKLKNRIEHTEYCTNPKAFV
jgi:hypothetical protein